MPSASVDALPPLNALRVFEAAARHSSFTRAAHELHVTQTAVSHQMRVLEAHLGLRLFVRLPRQLVLTAEGRAYAAELRRVFERIGDATANLNARPRREVLAVTSLPSFTARWLVPRLGQFAQSHPQTDLRILSTERPLDFSRESVDVGIRFGYGRYAGLRTEKLMDDECFPVCSPALLRRRPGLRTVADLRRQVLLHDDSADDWRRWLRAAGVTDGDPDRGHIFNDASMMLQAAADGHGVAMARRVLVESDLAERRLVRPFDLALPAEQAYYLVASEQTAQFPKVQAFRSWLLDQVEARPVTLPGVRRSPRIASAGALNRRTARPLVP
jgi:LysR family transcriptional regulator, glycine cleavage system transcriptional activator